MAAGKRAPKVKRAGKKARAKPATIASEPLDPRIKRLCAALSRDAELSASIREFEQRLVASGPRPFGSNGLKVKGKLFALFTQGTLVVKLPRGRVSELCAAEQGELFDPGHGRLMTEWLTVTSPKASWSALAREAFRFVSGARG